MKIVYIYSIVAVDKDKEEVLMMENAVGTDSTSALASFAVKNAKVLAGKNLHTYIQQVSSFNKD